MPLRSILFTIIVTTIIAWIGVGAFVSIIPPVDLSTWMLITFYGILLLALLGSFTSLGMIARIYVRKADVPVRQMTRSLRQGMSLSLLVVAALVLSHNALLNTWTLLLLVIGLAFIELFFLTSKSRTV